MRVFSKDETSEWLSKTANLGSEYVQWDGKGLFLAGPDASCIDIEYPKKMERLPFFAHCLSTIGYEDRDFESALLFFTEWGVWNSFDESIGYRIIEAMHGAAGQSKSFEVLPGHCFRADELLSAIGMLLQPMVFGWNAYYLPRWSYGTHQFFLHVSHDSFVSVVTRTKEFYDKAFALLKEWEFEARPGHEVQVRRFCRVS